MADPYAYPNGVLHNKLSIKDQEELERAKAQLTQARIAVLLRHGLTGPFDVKKLQTIHAYVFQDVYDWAGQFRITTLGKPSYEGGPISWFAPPDAIKPRLSRLFTILARENELRDLPRTTFAQRATTHFAQLNAIHPFREGNGRTQRVFFRALAQAAGHNLAFDVVSRERMTDVSVSAHAGNAASLRRLLLEISDPQRVAHLRAAITFLEENEFDWNARYLATMSDRQRYDGHLVAIGAESFIMHDGQRILVGRTDDLRAHSGSLPEPGDHISFVTLPPRN